MLISNPHNTAEVSGVTSSKFGFEMNAKMYDILISKMYTNKQGAVIRELSANAWDAHVEAGKNDVPFDISLPTWLDKSFSIRDYGTGIPHDKFETIYTNVGSSTKENTNELIGGFGLGSKTPFTMTDTFMVENWNQGIKTTWLCFKDKGEPQVSKVGEEPSDEPCGLKVSFTFDEGDVASFTREVPKQLRFFPVKPNITGGTDDIEFAKLPAGWENKKYFYVPDSYENYVIMGNVAYEVSSYSFDYNYSKVFNGGLCIKVNIGDVDIPPSRENIEITPRTKASIEAILCDIKADYEKDVQDEANKIDKLLKGLALLNNKNRSLFKVRNIKFPLLTKDEVEILYDYACMPHRITSILECNIHHIQRVYKNPYRQTYIGSNLYGKRSYTYYLNDIGRGAGKLVRQAIEDKTHSIKDLSASIILTMPSVSNKDLPKEVPVKLKKLEEELDCKVELLSSVLPKVTATIKQQVIKKPVITSYQCKSQNNIISDTKLWSKLTTLEDMPDKAYYLELYKTDVNNTTIDINSLLEKGLLTFLDMPLIFVRKKAIKDLPKGVIQLQPSHLEQVVTKLAEKIEKLELRYIQYLKFPDLPKTHRTFLSKVGTKKLKLFERASRFLNGVNEHTISIERRTRVSQELNKLKGLYSLIKGQDFNVELPKATLDKYEELYSEYFPISDVLSAVTYSYSQKRNQENIETLISLISNLSKENK